MTQPPSSPRLEPRLHYELLRVLRPVRAVRLHQRGLLIWSALAALALVGLVLSALWPQTTLVATRAILPAFVIAAAAAAWLAWRDRTDLRAAVDAVSRLDPAVAARLRAAVEQHPDEQGRFHFLQRRLIHETLQAANARDWAAPLRRRARHLFWAHGLAMAGALTLSILILAQPRPRTAMARLAAVSDVVVTPGDVDLEAGASVLIAGRFPSPLPTRVDLVSQVDGEAPRRTPMERSLSDPVFAAPVRDVRRDVVYRLEFAGVASPDYRLRVYELPAVVRTDAALDYPDYTNQPSRRIEDTRTVSAVVGTQLELELLASKPVARATLAASDGAELEMTPLDESRTRFGLRRTIAESERFTVRLEDDDGRTNRHPPTLRIDALPNRRPELRLSFPSGDVRVSPLEEMTLLAEASDDFGLHDYGLAVAVDAGEPTYVSLAGAPDAPTIEARLEHQVALEPRNVQPDQLITWFAWADDIGPDGTVRRTMSDLAFAEVRPFEETFRENATGGRAAGGAGRTGGDLLELQRHISVAIWKLRQTDGNAAEREARRITLRDSQAAARQQLEELRVELDRERWRAAADRAAEHMDRAHDHLESSDPAALEPAWSAAQGAYQALLALQPRETEVAQSRNPGGGSGRRSRQQLDELEFRHEEDRYATESQAQAPASPEEREQLELLARLRELARRQEHLNERLQELQAALAAADEERREELQRELKRLEDEQRRMLADLDEARQRADRMSPGERSREARQQLEQTREAMQRAGEELSEGSVSSALAAGTRARENLQRTGEGLRSAAAGRFGEQLRDARRQARELAEQQQAIRQELDGLLEGPAQLDDSDAREALAQRLEEQRARRESLVETLRQIAQDSEAAEPQLHRQVYDLVREQSRGAADAQLTTSAEWLRRGFLEPVREPQRDLARAFETLQRDVERAARAVLGDETSELRYAQGELDALTRELRRERDGPAGASGESEPDGAAPAADPALAQLEAFARASAAAAANGDAPISGSGFGEWSDRLRTVEGLMEDADLRQQLAQARAAAEEMRREFHRHGRPPQWELIDTAVVAPLSEARGWLDQELKRRLQPDALQPIDREPVPERYAEAVRRYYEALGEE